MIKFEFEFVNRSLSPVSKLGISATKMVNRFNESKKLRKLRKNELSPLERLKLNEVTVRETPAEEVERRMRLIKREVERV